jgi:cytochrome c oxidase subunit 3
MAGAKNHQYHILSPSIWPLIGALGALTMAIGAVMYMHGANVSLEKANGGGWIFFGGLLAVLFVMVSWWADVVKEANGGDHTPVVQLHHRYGMILFIASEVMFFVAWFWAYFNASLFPAPIEMVGEAWALNKEAVVAGTWPPEGMHVLDPFGWPLLNTMILLCSGTTVTWAHHCIIHGDRKGLIQGLWLTIILGVIFSGVQAYEYYHAPFGYADNIYTSTFFMATGFHGFHVLVGTIFLIVCLLRAYNGGFTAKQHFGFEAAAWYWHFVDVVWLFLFLFVYVWGGWGADFH